MHDWSVLYNKIQPVVNRTNHIIYRRVNKLIDVRDKSILEIGSGIGSFSYLSALGGARRICLVDNCKTALEKAREVFAGVDCYKDFVNADIFDELNFGKFDVVISSGLVEHFSGDRQIQLVKRHADYVKNDGKIVIVVPANWHWNNIRCLLPSQKRLYGWERPLSLKKMAELMHKAGIKIELLDKFCATYGVFNFPGCRYLHKIIEFPIESNSYLDSLFGGLIFALGSI
jgi:SAM-dependent methyltransferase